MWALIRARTTRGRRNGGEGRGGREARDTLQYN
ncbi:hypothetical protein COLO4_26169 [Corchorus olitorius]|uniref:Uncharacterized protein n=1 Tax=Corchorus olitorius TaxID=93759 RepID=A0A1R3HYE0_9ROSI|nr:hypothetical protein COLO4_26169 [Corchorus olitorius]